MDWSVGQIMAAVEELGLKENTFVYFSSDNGPHLEEIKFRRIPWWIEGYLQRRKRPELGWWHQGAYNSIMARTHSSWDLS